MITFCTDNLQEEECIAPEFSINLIFNLQQLYDDQKLCDFTIKVDGKEFKVIVITVWQIL